jgi:hypothetical protein
MSAPLLENHTIRLGRANSEKGLKPTNSLQEENMTETKSWYLSRTIWASLITVATALAGILGAPVEGLDNSALTDTLLQVVTAVAGLVAIFGRLSAKNRIG